MSDVMDDNELSAIACLCRIRAELLIPDLDAWLQADENLVYQSKYVPTEGVFRKLTEDCLLYTSPSPRDVEESRMPSSA